jgi:hypothetical protein
VERVWEEAPAAPLLDGRYRLGECVGQGGMGKVYRADDVVLGRTVAVKTVAPAAGVSNALDRVRNEVTLLAAVQHPSLVTLLDARIEDAGSSYLVMEYVDGPSLARHMRGGPLTEVEVATLALDLASGLDAVHAAGVVHRDLTPANILLAPSVLPKAPFRAKLADFGVAFLIDSTRLTTPGMVVGTAAYLAPEQVRGDAAAPPADVYALGLVLLEALTGERAYPHASGIGAVMARLVEPPKIPADIGAEWTGLLSRMIASDPAERPSAGEVATIAAGLRKTARPVPMVERADAAASASPADPAATQPMLLAPAGVVAPTQPLVQIAPAAPARAEVPAPASPAAPASAEPPAAPATRVVAGSGDRATLRRRRVRVQRWRRAGLLVGSAAVIAALAIPAGLWSAPGYPEEPSLIATVPDVAEPEPIVPDGTGSSESEMVPASTGSTSQQADEKQARELAKQAEEQARAQQKLERESAKAQAAADREQAKAERGGQRDR